MEQEQIDQYMRESGKKVDLFRQGQQRARRYERSFAGFLRRRKKNKIKKWTFERYGYDSSIRLTLEQAEKFFSAFGLELSKLNLPYIALNEFYFDNQRGSPATQGTVFSPGPGVRCEENQHVYERREFENLRAYPEFSRELDYSKKLQGPFDDASLKRPRVLIEGIYVLQGLPLEYFGERFSFPTPTDKIPFQVYGKLPDLEKIIESS